MDIFFAPYKSKKSNHNNGNCKYQPYYCYSEQQYYRIFKKWNDLWNFCGIFSVSENNLVHGINLIQSNTFDNYLINLERAASKIICNLCSHKFELRRQGDQIAIYKYKGNAQVGKSCLYCYLMEKRKNYSKCKKCQQKLLFFPLGLNPVKQCSSCNLKHCVYCKKAITHFRTDECKCRLTQVEQRIRYLKIILFLDIIFTILGLILISYLENSEFYQSIKCSFANWFQDPLCIGEQVGKDFKKIAIIMIISLFQIFQGLIIVELISKLIRQSKKWIKIKTDKPLLLRG